MGYLYIALLSLLVTLPGLHLTANANASQLNESNNYEQTPSVSEPDKQINHLGDGVATMKKTIESYVKGSDTQHTELIDTVFHNNFQVFVHTEDAVKVLDKSTYLELLETGKIGGVNREIEYLDLHTDNLVGTARIRLVGKTGTFYDHLSLVKEQDVWKIVSNTTYVIPVE